jgi:lactobin A/cerein 7B family class IIb bacteriocin
VKELDESELMEVEGGGIGGALIAGTIVGGALGSAACHFYHTYF